MSTKDTTLILNDYQTFLHHATATLRDNVAHPSIKPYLDHFAEVDRHLLVLRNPPTGTIPTAMVLALNAKALLLSALHAALSGQTAPIPGLLRSALESMLYAVVIHRTPAKALVWQATETARKERTKQFGWAAVQNEARRCDRSFAEVTDGIYDTLINIGAHPNSQGVLPNLTHSRSQDGRSVTLGCLYPAGSNTTKFSLILCCSVGAIVLAWLAHALPSSDQTGAIYDSGYLLYEAAMALPTHGQET